MLSCVFYPSPSRTEETEEINPFSIIHFLRLNSLSLVKFRQSRSILAAKSGGKSHSSASCCVQCSTCTLAVKSRAGQTLYIYFPFLLPACSRAGWSVTLVILGYYLTWTIVLWIAVVNKVNTLSSVSVGFQRKTPLGNVMIPVLVAIGICMCLWHLHLSGRQILVRWRTKYTDI